MELYPFACIPKKKSLSVAEWLSSHSQMSTIAQQPSVRPGSVQTHFPLGALMEKISAFHLWHHSLHDRFQPPLTFKERRDLQAALRHVEPPVAGDEERLLESACESNYCEEISLSHFTCAFDLVDQEKVIPVR